MVPGRSGSDCRSQSEIGVEFQLCYLGDGQDTEPLFSQFPYLQNTSDNSLYPVYGVRLKWDIIRDVLSTTLGPGLRGP